MAAIADHLARHPLGDARARPTCDVTSPIAYVADAGVREHWDAAELGPMHRASSAVGPPPPRAPRRSARSATPSSDHPPPW